MSGSIIRRIIIGFGIVLALALVAAIIGGSALAHARQANVDLSRQVLTDDVMSRDLETHFLRANANLLRVLLEPNEPRWRAARESELKQAVDLAASLADSVDDAPAKRLWADVGAALAKWDEAAGRSAQAAAAGKRDEATVIHTNETLPMTQRIEQDVARGVATEVRQTREQIDASTASIGRATSLLWLASLGTLIAGIMASVIVIRSITRPLRESTGTLATSSAEILAATSEQASGANESMAAVAQTAATVDQVAQTTEQAAQRARVVAEGAQRATEISRKGRTAVDASINQVNRVLEQVESMRTGIRAVAEQAELIRGITSTVDDIAERSNLLALNAAIEAARAGDEGRGFSVVATEIRSLAEQSKRATVEVRNILADIQRATASAASVAEDGARQAADSARAISEAGETIRALGETISESSHAAAQIAASAGQQATGMAQIRQAMRNIREVTQQNLVATQQTERAAKDLTGIGNSLVALVGGNGRRLG